MRPGFGALPDTSVAPRRTAAPACPAVPPNALLRGRGPAWPAWLAALLRRLREREELLSLGPRERRDARLTDYDVRALLARKPLRRP
jgi:hypothetical protein